MSNRYSRKITSFHGYKTPEEGYTAGYATIIDYLNKKGIQVPMLTPLCITTTKHQRYDTDQWQVYTVRHTPEDNLKSHITFALKYEGIDLYIFKKLFAEEGSDLVLQMINEEPTSQYTRRVWFLYEWLMDTTLDVSDLKSGTYVELINAKYQYTATPINSTRHRIKNNLPGTKDFCPLIRKTEKLESYINADLSNKIDRGLSKHEKELVRRTAAFLLLKDSKASFAIEGEFPPNHRARNWGRAIGQAGKHELSIAELERLQDLMIGSQKLKHMGIRTTEGFIGEHDRDTFSPIPDHISAKASDLEEVLGGLISTDEKLKHSDYNPVLTAATIAFGFVFIHPFSDGNGRIHRFIIHHILSLLGFTRQNMIFPVSASILQHIGEYQRVLELYSHNRIDLIEWKETPDHNVEILNDTADLYKYYDLTAQAEFLFDCVADTIDNIIPNELRYLQRHDQMKREVDLIVSLPDTQLDLIMKMMDQNEGKLSKAKRKNEFAQLSDEEISSIELIYQNIFTPE